MATSPARLLEAWEAASGLPPVERAVAIAAVARPDMQAEVIADLPLGMRDALLIELRIALFGDRFDCLVDCPHCGDVLEFAVSAGGLAAATSGLQARELEARHGSYRLRYRAPSSSDLAALSGLGIGSAEAERSLVERCVYEAQGPDGPVALPELPGEAIDRLAEEMELADPLAIVWLDLRCLHCGHAWQSLLDVASLVWTEVDAWAGRLLRQVHQLAAAYGWSEAEVLRISEFRRERYLRMVRA